MLVANAVTPRVLVIDDEARNRTLCRRILAAEYHVLEAEDGPSALKLLENEEVDLVLLDVMMPGMNGFEVCSRIKAEAEDYLPVLFLTALGEQEERNAGLHAGADDFICKPFDRRELLLRVAAFVRLRRHEATVRRQMKELRELQELKDDLVSLLVHDLRNPLAGMISFLEVLREEVASVASSELADDFQQALGAANRMRSALDEVLRVRQLEDGALALRREPLHPSEAVAEAVAAAQGVARARNVELRSAGTAEVVLSADRDLVVRSVENLLHNAIRYSKPGSAVDVTVRSEDGGAWIAVADRGPGIPLEMRERLFEKFASLESRSNGARRGFGLGLYLVNLTVTAHGGRASVSDRVGGGTVFALFFPAGP